MSRREFSLSVIRAEPATLDLTVRVAWHAWVAVEKIQCPRADLAEFARALRDFGEHDRTEVELTIKAADKELQVVASEYGLARKAAFGVHMVRRDDSHGSLNWPSEIRIQLPTEHGLMGEFAADIAQLLATDSGVAVLRLLQHWPG